MKLLKALTFLSLLLSSYMLSAQDGDEIKFGEEPILRAVTDSTATQLIASMAVWYPTVQRGTAERKRLESAPFSIPQGPICDYPSKYVANPGKIIEYKYLNIFIYLGDLIKLNNYLLHGSYPGTSSSAVKKSKIADQKKAKEQAFMQGRRPTAQANTNTMATNGASANAYPFVRQSLFHRYGPVKNPAYFPLQTGGFMDNKEYSEKVKNYKILANLYQGFLINPSQRSCSPHFHPSFYFEKIQYELSPLLQEFDMKLVTIMEDEMKRQLNLLKAKNDKEFTTLTSRLEESFRSRNLSSIERVLDDWYVFQKASYSPELYKAKTHSVFLKHDHKFNSHTSLSRKVARLRTRVVGRGIMPINARSKQLTEARINKLIPALQTTPLPARTRAYVNSVARKLAGIAQPLRFKYNSLSGMYKVNRKKNKQLLKPSDVQFFEWTLQQSNQLLSPIEAMATYSQQMTNMPITKTSYAQLMVVSELVRIARESTRTGSEGADVLKLATQAHHDEVQSTMQVFKRR